MRVCVRACVCVCVRVCVGVCTLHFLTRYNGSAKKVFLFFVILADGSFKQEKQARNWHFGRLAIFAKFRS